MTKVDFLDIIKLSGDSKLIDINFIKNTVTILLELGDTDETITLDMKTSHIYVKDTLSGGNDAKRNCFIKLSDLHEDLATQNGYYIPPNSFQLLMKEAKSKYNLAYGLKSQNFKYMISLVSSELLFACILSNIDDISPSLQK